VHYSHNWPAVQVLTIRGVSVNWPGGTGRRANRPANCGSCCRSSLHCSPLFLLLQQRFRLLNFIAACPSSLLYTFDAKKLRKYARVAYQPKKYLAFFLKPNSGVVEFNHLVKELGRNCTK
jgi:hypothetical protein